MGARLNEELRGVAFAQHLLPCACGTGATYWPTTLTSVGIVALDFRKRVQAARDDADAEDMDDAMSGPAVPEEGESADDPIVCCPKCRTEFPVSEGLYEESSKDPGPPSPADMVDDSPPDPMEDDFQGFTVGGR